MAAGAYYERAIAAFKEGDYCLNYVKALQGWASLEAQARNANKAKFLYVEAVRISYKVEIIVFHDYCSFLVHLFVLVYRHTGI